MSDEAFELYRYLILVGFISALVIAFLIFGGE